MKQSKVNAIYLPQFLSDLLPWIIFHQNQMKYFKNVITAFRENFECLIDIDFSESAHWNHEQVTVHFGILKNKGQKSYYSHLSDNKKHIFVNVVLQRILNPNPDMPREQIKIGRTYVSDLLNSVFGKHGNL